MLSSYRDIFMDEKIILFQTYLKTCKLDIFGIKIISENCITTSSLNIYLKDGIDCII